MCRKDWLTDGYRSAPVFLKHFSVQCNIFLCKGSHQVEANFQINTEKWRATLQQTSGWFFFFFLFRPLAPVSETKRSLVTHLSSVLKNPSDFSGAKNKSPFFFFFEYGTSWCRHTWQLNISVKGIRENGSQQSQRKRDSLHIQGPETSARVWQH